MEFDKLKSTWQNAGKDGKDQKELLMMTKIKNHPQTRRIRLKFAIEVFLLIVFSIVYYDAFDGASKALWTNVLLIGSAIAFIVTRFVGWIKISNPVNGNNLKKSLEIFHDSLRRMSILVLSSSFLFGVALIIFFTLSVSLTNEKVFLVVGMVISLLLFIYLSYRNWNQRIKNIERTLENLK